MPISDCAKPVKVTVLRGNCRLLVRSAIPTSQSQPMAAWKCFCLNSDEARISSVSNLRSTIRGKGFSRTDWILKDNVRNGSPGGGKMFKTRASEKPENDSPLKSQGEPVRSKGFLDAFIGPLLQSLSDFGFGRRSIWEGGVGLFIITGGFMFALLISWAKGRQVRSSSTRYQTVFEFSQACGITVGTPVRIRGVDVGSVIGVKPSLERIDVTAEIMDAGVVIPRNSLVEVNQSGLISETLIDITPQNPIPRPTVGPLHPECHNEGLIVCDRQHITGVQGVSLDELVGICTKLAKQMDQEGIQSMFQAMDKVSETIDDAKPLLDKVTQITSDLQPLLKEISDGDLLKNLEALTKVVTDATGDLRKLNSSVLTVDNVKLLRESVATLTKTLHHVERISGDLSGLTGDPKTQSHLKQLIESLSRLIDD